MHPSAIRSHVHAQENRKRNAATPTPQPNSSHFFNLLTAWQQLAGVFAAADLREAVSIDAKEPVALDSGSVSRNLNPNLHDCPIGPVRPPDACVLAAGRSLASDRLNEVNQPNISELSGRVEQYYLIHGSVRCIDSDSNIG